MTGNANFFSSTHSPCQVSSLFKVIIFMVETGQKWVRNIGTQYFGIGRREKVVGRRKMT